MLFTLLKRFGHITNHPLANHEKQPKKVALRASGSHPPHQYIQSKLLKMPIFWVGRHDDLKTVPLVHFKLCHAYPRTNNMLGVRFRGRGRLKPIFKGGEEHFQNFQSFFSLEIPKGYFKAFLAILRHFQLCSSILSQFWAKVSSLRCRRDRCYGFRAKPSSETNSAWLNWP